MSNKLQLQYWMESADRVPLAGISPNIRQITSAPALTHNIYCEEPRCSTDGRRIALYRQYRLGPDTTNELLVYDLSTYRLGLLARDVIAVATAPWSGILFATISQNDRRRLVRFDLNQLTADEVCGLDRFPPRSVYAVNADSRYGLGSARLDDRRMGIYRLDLFSGSATLIHESPDIPNPHLQFRRFTSSRILIQENRGGQREALSDVFRTACDERGVGLYSIASDGSDRRDLPVGPPITPSTTGHECWIGDTDRVLVTVSAPHADGRCRGNLLEIDPDHRQPRVVSESGEIWNHISASSCGRYFVTDCYGRPETPIIVGSIRTGKTAILCHGDTTGGGGQYSHLHPYLTTDNRDVIFNSDRTGLAQVYAAEVPDGLLASLD